jgi:hypothetical protein
MMFIFSVQSQIIRYTKSHSSITWSVICIIPFWKGQNAYEIKRIYNKNNKGVFFSLSLSTSLIDTCTVTYKM